MNPRNCILTDLPVPTRTGRGRPSEYVSTAAKDLWNRWQFVMGHMGALQYTPEYARYMRAMCVVLVNGVRTVKDGVESAPRTVSKVHHAVDMDTVTDEEAALIQLLVATAAAYGTLQGKSCKLTRCVTTGSIIYAGTRNPRKYVNDDARLLDLRMQQLRTLLQQVVFTPHAAKRFRGEMYALSCSMNANRIKNTLGTDA